MQLVKSSYCNLIKFKFNALRLTLVLFKNDSKSIYNSTYSIGLLILLILIPLSFLKRTKVSRNALNLNFIKLQYEDFTICIFTFI